MLEQSLDALAAEVRKLSEAVEHQDVLLARERDTAQPPRPAQPPRNTGQRPAPAPPESQQLLNETEVARLVKVSVATVRRWRLFRTGPRSPQDRKHGAVLPGQGTAWVEECPRQNRNRSDRV